MTSYERRCDVMTSHRRRYDVILAPYAQGYILKMSKVPCMSEKSHPQSKHLGRRRYHYNTIPTRQWEPSVCDCVIFVLLSKRSLKVPTAFAVTSDNMPVDMKTLCHINSKKVRGAGLWKKYKSRFPPEQWYIHDSKTFSLYVVFYHIMQGFPRLPFSQFLPPKPCSGL